MLADEADAFPIQGWSVGGAYVVLLWILENVISLGCKEDSIAWPSASLVLVLQKQASKRNP